MGWHRSLSWTLAVPGACWIAAELGLAFLGMPLRGCCGRPLPFELEHVAASFAGVVALACTWIGRRALDAAQGNPEQAFGEQVRVFFGGGITLRLDAKSDPR